MTATSPGNDVDSNPAGTTETDASPPNSPSGKPVSTILLLSGGLDSAALAAWITPTYTLFVDYGQRPATAERRAAAAVARQLGLAHDSLNMDLTPVGGGLLSEETPSAGWPSPEWWPYRNQFLVTAAAAWALKQVPGVATGNAHARVVTGTVASDGARHQDGTVGFYNHLDALLRYQEGNVSVAPLSIELTSVEVLANSGVGDDVLGWTHSCHRADFPCGDCPGCHKREQVLDAAGRLR